MNSYEVSGSPRCPGCGSVTDGASVASPEARAPREGDVAICLYCCHIGIYVGESQLRIETLSNQQLQMMEISQPGTLEQIEYIQRTNKVILAEKQRKLN